MAEEHTRKDFKESLAKIFRAKIKEKIDKRLTNVPSKSSVALFMGRSRLKKMGRCSSNGIVISPRQN